MRVGQLVTWPKVKFPRVVLFSLTDHLSQLRMIANRAKIEKQIYLGRQFVRKSSKSKTASTPENTSPRPGLLFPPTSTTPPPSGSDRPLSVDTDAEKAFTHNSRSFIRNKRIHISPSNSGASTPREHGRHSDPLRSPASRRKWASSLLNTGGHVSQQSTIPASSNSGSEGFFTRLRTKSLSTLASGRTQKDMPIEPTEDAWSSDTSSEDDLVDVLADDDHEDSLLLQEEDA